MKRRVSDPKLCRQACSGIVQTAQTLDSLLATFIFDETFALQVSPAEPPRPLAPTDSPARSCRPPWRSCGGAMRTARPTPPPTPARPSGERAPPARSTPSSRRRARSDKGPMVITLGYLLMALLYWPVGKRRRR